MWPLAAEIGEMWPNNGKHSKIEMQVSSIHIYLRKELRG